MTASKARFPLDGIRVLAAEQFLSGPMCTMWLGDLGAEVIKVEAPGKGDPRRSLPPTLRNEAGESISGTFMDVNRNKKSITLDLKSEAGRRIFKELAAHSDVIVENMKPGTMERLGLDYPVLRTVNPRIIYAALSGFGRMEGYRGPYSDRPAFDPVVQAMGGIMDRVGEADGPPLLAIAGTADRVTAIVTGYAIVAALFMRERTGIGQMVDIAMYDSMLPLNERAISMYSYTRKVLSRGKDELYAPIGSFRVRDGWVALLVVGEDQWQRFCQAVGRPDLFEHPLCRGTSTRVSNWKSFLKPIVDEWMAAHTRDEVVDTLNAHGVPAGIVQSSEDLFHCPQVEARHMLLEIDDPVAGRQKLANNPFRFSEAPEKPPIRPPRLGEHNREILSGVLGYSDAEIDHLAQAGVL